jgi:uncharacterized repeat protein (TIGR02543 family)
MTSNGFLKPNRFGSKAISLVSTAILTFVSVFVIGSNAQALEEMTPVINFEGNVLARDVVHSQKGQRLEQYQVTLDPSPLRNSLTTDRPGYTFGGWSYAAGGPAVNTLTASQTSTRVVLYAVWKTELRLDTNGATSGSLSGGQTSLDYRFNQDLLLPFGGTIKKKGYSFAGWTLAPNSMQVVTTYRAGPSDSGNASLYAAWKKTISFASKGSVGVLPSSLTIFEGGAGVSLPTASQVLLTRSGYTFMGWSTTPKGKVVKNSASYLPKKADVTLNAVWKKN